MKKIKSIAMLLFVVCNVVQAMELSFEFYHEKSEMSVLMRAIEKKELDILEENLITLERKNSKATVSKGYSCKRKNCTFSSNHENRITRHCAMHKLQDAGVTMYHCDICDFLTDRQKNMDDHNLSHDDKKQYHCKVCNAWFKSSNGRNRHIRESLIHKQNSKNRPFLVLTNG